MAITLNGTTGIQNVLGSASAPAESNTTSSNTGLYFPTSTTLGLSTAGTNALYVDASQNVGIGTTSPSKKLEVYAASNSLQILSVVRNDQSGTGVAAIGFNTSSSSSGEATSTKAGIGLIRGFAFGGGALAFYNNNSGAAGDFTTADEKMRIDASGNLLVGTTTQVGKLNVVASSNIGAGYTQYLRNTWSGDVGYPGIYLAKYDNNTTTSQIFVRFSVNNEATASGQINANGANSAAFGSFSDRRLKENIVDLSSQLANICSLRPAEFDFKDGSGHQIGFIAQEMQEVYPDVVGVGADDMLTITGWSKTEARLVKAIQELKAEFDAYKASHA